MPHDVDPVSKMLEIAEKFLSQATEFDARADGAVESNAAAGDITKLMDLAAVFRMRALTAFGQCAPYCRPRLQAIEVSPVSESTASRLEKRISGMSEDEISSHLRQIAAGGSALQLIEGAADD